jgi:glutamate-1-semialdehyde 2,1-aminomutase
VIDPEAVYRQTSPRSRALHERAVKAMPGGTTRTTTYFDPYPVYIERGEGCRVWDADGVERIDMIGNYTAMILGHSHPKIVEAIRAQAARGTGFAAANQLEVELAELLCERVPSLDAVRFCNSGTEATMFAMRLARAFTGRPKIARMEGGYHGTHDYAEVSTHPAAGEGGPADEPEPVADSLGTPAWAIEEVVVLPFNHPDAAERIIRREGSALAAVIVEPIIGAGGVIAATPEFLGRLRDVTRELGILLIFDEVISFRVAPGGAQQTYGVTPDLTTLGKIIGGGLPVGAYGGRAHVMDHVAPSGPVYQAGTLSGNPLAMAAGAATLDVLQAPATYERLEALTRRLCGGLERAAKAAGVPVTVNRAASLFTVFFCPGPVTDYASAKTADTAAFARFFHAMLDRGFYLPPAQLEAAFVSLAHTEADIDATIGAARDVFGTALQRG